MEERRDYNRLAFEAQMTLHAAQSKEYLCEANTRDVSYTGIGLKAPRDMEPGTVVDFTLKTAYLEEPLTGTAAVRYCRQASEEKNNLFLLGLEFIDPQKDTILHILNRVQKQFAQQLRTKSRIPPLDFIPY